MQAFVARGFGLVVSAGRADVEIVTVRKRNFHSAWGRPLFVSMASSRKQPWEFGNSTLIRQAGTLDLSFTMAGARHCLVFVSLTRRCTSASRFTMPAAGRVEQLVHVLERGYSRRVPAPADLQRRAPGKGCDAGAWVELLEEERVFRRKSTIGITIGAKHPCMPPRVAKALTCAIPRAR